MRRGIALMLASTLAGCGLVDRLLPGDEAEPAVSGMPAASASASAAASGSAEPVVGAAAPAPPSPCPKEMALIAGRFCMDKWEASAVTKEGEPHSPFHRPQSKPLRAMSKAGVVPQAHISMIEAELACQRVEKKLCTTQQFVDACMGTGKPKRWFPYGNRAVKGRCNVHRSRHPTLAVFGKRKDDAISLNHPKLNQQPDTIAKTGEFSECVTPEGVYDLHGNLLEWTKGPKGNSLLMGGHYLDGKIHGPGCTYVTDGHGPQYGDFTTGFRCCKKPDPEALAAAEPASASTVESRDPPGMRSFVDPLGALPDPKPPAYGSEEAACPVDMVLVEGLRCSSPVQTCKRWLTKKQISCAEFEKPSRCEGPKLKKRFCIDRYEYTPEGYTYPLTHVNWGEAQILCRKMDKRVCMEDEWEFACEGEEARPYPYGYERHPEWCNHDFPEIELVTPEKEFIDRRQKKDALPKCESPFGVFNMVGNVDEWTTRYGAKAPRRSILRGGWWLQGRNRCRAATANHSELYAGMQTGVRCCKAAR